MEVRDAVEGDAPALAEFVDLPPDVMRNVVHDRSVRVAVETADDEGGESGVEGESEVEDENGNEDPPVRGFVSFDVLDGVVHVTQFGGERDVLERLLAEPLGFASREGMGVEFLVAESEADVREAAESVGFEARGSGPRFEGEPTVRYRHVE